MEYSLVWPFKKNKMYEYDVSYEPCIPAGKYKIKFIAKSRAAAEEHCRMWARTRAARVIAVEIGKGPAQLGIGKDGWPIYRDDVEYRLSKLGEPTYSLLREEELNV